MSDSYEESKSYKVGADELFNYALSAVKAAGLDVDNRDINLGVIKASVATTMSKFGHDVEITIMPEGQHRSKISVTCSTRYVLARLDPFGRFRKEEQKRVAKLFTALDFIVQRASVAKGS
jgi:hypothetical protein